jgi:hypothetical protein
MADLTLAWIGCGLVIVGFLFSLSGVWLESRAFLPYDAGRWTDWIRDAARCMFAALPRLPGRNPPGVRFQALGSALTYLGLIVLLAFLWLATGR